MNEPTVGRRIGVGGAALWTGRARLVTGLRFALWCATALWAPVVALPGDTTAQARSYDALEWLAAWLHLPTLTPWLSPAELLIATLMGGCALFSAVDYLVGGSRYGPARVYLATVAWVGLAASYLVSNPIGYGTWLFVLIALLHWWCLVQARA